MFIELTGPSRCSPEKKKKNIQHYSCEKHFVQKGASFSGNVEYVECVLGMFSKYVFISGERLNVLNMLNAFGTCRPLLNEANKFQKHSTYSTFPKKEAHFWREAFKHIQHIQHFRRKMYIL